MGDCQGQFWFWELSRKYLWKVDGSISDLCFWGCWTEIALVLNNLNVFRKPVRYPKRDYQLSKESTSFVFCINKAFCLMSQVLSEYIRAFNLQGAPWYKTSMPETCLYLTFGHRNASGPYLTFLMFISRWMLQNDKSGEWEPEIPTFLLYPEITTTLW